MEALMAELKVKLIGTLGLDDVRPEDIGDDDPLIGDGLGLDSIDVLELAVLLEQEYGAKIDDKQMGQRAFASIRALAAFIEERRASAA